MKFNNKIIMIIKLIKLIIIQNSFKHLIFLNKIMNINNKIKNK